MTALNITLNTDAARRVITLALLGACLLSAGYWLQAGFKAWRPPAAAGSAAALARPVPAVSVMELARVLGAPPEALNGVAAGLAQRFRLAGVIASASGQGAALLSMDGQPARTFLVGAEIASGLWLQSVGPAEAMLAGSMQGPVMATLRVPELPTADASPPAVAAQAVMPAPGPAAAAAAPEAPVRSMRAAPN
jgi:general secretion pathway protein C